MIRRTVATAGVLVVALALAGVAGASSSENPRDVAEAVTKASLLGQYGRVWARLHPAYQHALSRSWWEHCKSKNDDKGYAALVHDAKAIDDYRDTLAFPLLGRRHVRAVTMQAYVGKVKVTTTRYWTLVAGKWRGLLTFDEYRAYRAHRCPS